MVDVSLVRSGLSPHAIVIYLVLKSFMSQETRQCWPSIATIASHAGMSVNTVRRAVHVLCLEGLVKCESRPDGQRSNLYTFPRRETDA